MRNRRISCSDVGMWFVRPLGFLPQAPQAGLAPPIIESVDLAAVMSLLFIVAFGWLSMRTLLLLSQVNRHSPESRLGRAFQQELRNRGLTADLGETDRLSP